jgi:hypothetical protein
MTSDQRDLGLLVVSGAIALAALIAAVGGATGSWVGDVGGFVVDVLLVGLVVVGAPILVYVGLAWAMPKLVATGGQAIERVRDEPDAPALLPALTTFLSVALVGASHEILADDPVLKWLLTVAVAIVTLAGATLAYLGFGRAVTLAGFVALASPALVIVIAGSRDWSSWWETYLSWSTSDQAYLVAGLVAYVLTLLTSVLVALYGWSRRRKEAQQRAAGS